jgi:archaellum component FlaC
MNPEEKILQQILEEITALNDQVKELSKTVKEIRNSL